MIQVASENFNNQEDFLGLGKKNKEKRQEKKAVRQEKRAAKKEARQGKSIFGKIANVVGVGKQAKAIRQDAKAAKTQIKQTGTFNRGTVASGTIRKPTPTIKINPKFGGAQSGKPLIKTPTIKTPTPFRGGVTGGIVKTILGSSGIQKLPTPVQEQRGGAAPVMDYPQEQMPQQPQMPSNPQMEQMPQYQTMANPQMEQAMQMPQLEQSQVLDKEEKADPNAEKPFNWKLWGSVGGGVILIIVVVLIVVFTKK